MSRWRILLLVAVTLTLHSGFARAQEEPRGLPRWFLGFQFASSARSSYDVFERTGVPPAPVMDPGGGGGGQFGYRFGDRFLLAMQLVLTTHDVAQPDTRLHDGEALITGTVLYRERSTLQPFLRGGLGGTVLVFEEPTARTLSLGLAADIGGGVQWKLARALAVELEVVARFANYTNGKFTPREGDLPDDEWAIRRSNAGYRIGVGLVFWF